MTFKPGAFGSGSAVQPIILRFSGWNTYSWTFGQNPTNLGLLTFLTMCQPIINVEMEYLPVYHPRQEEMKDAMLYANNVRQLMAQELNIPISDWTRENGFILDRALKHKMNPIVADFNYYTVSKASNMTYKEMIKILDGFCEIERDEKEMISIPNLVEYIESDNNSQDGKRLITSLKIVSNEKLTFANLLVRMGQRVGNVPKESLTLKSLLLEDS